MIDRSWVVSFFLYSIILHLTIKGGRGVLPATSAVVVGLIDSSNNVLQWCKHGPLLLLLLLLLILPVIDFYLQFNSIQLNSTQHNSNRFNSATAQWLNRHAISLHQKAGNTATKAFPIPSHPIPSHPIPL